MPNRDLAPKTVELYQWTADLIRDELGGRRVADLTVDHVEAMLDRLATRGVNPLGRSTLTKVNGTLQRSLTFAERPRQGVAQHRRSATHPPRPAPATARSAPTTPERCSARSRHERNGLMLPFLRLGLRPGRPLHSGG
ncbi:MAG: hypothetical protein R2697_19190 [Ilumatobacteraceae bacterium]